MPEVIDFGGQPQYVWPPSFALAKAYLDQLERGRTFDMDRIGALRQQIAAAELFVETVLFFYDDRVGSTLKPFGYDSALFCPRTDLTDRGR